MNESAVIEDIQEKFGLLPSDSQERLLSLLGSHIDMTCKGTPGRDLLRFAGTIPKEDLILMEQSIERECERVDSSEW